MAARREDGVVRRCVRRPRDGRRGFEQGGVVPSPLRRAGFAAPPRHRPGVVRDLAAVFLRGGAPDGRAPGRRRVRGPLFQPHHQGVRRALRPRASPS